MKIRLVLFLLLCSTNIIAQKRFTISGYITDSTTGEELISANVFETKSYEGVTSNNYGFYSLTLPAGDVTVAFSYVGYKVEVKKLNLNKNMHINVSLAPKQLEEVKIFANSVDKKIESSQMSKIDIPIEKIQNLPAFLGEADVIKTLQLLPGVQSGSEGSSGLYVRGGGPDQNLLLLDGVPVYNANHLLGFFSVFNPNAIKNVTLYKGGFPARFGGRLSSVVDVRMKEGNQKEYHGKFSIGLISSNFNLEGPIIKDRTAFNISFRRTYGDLLAQPILSSDSKLAAYFYDLNAKINHKFSDKSRLFLSVYSGDDVFSNESESEDEYQWEKSENDIRWGNLTTALRWNYIFSDKLFCNTTATYSRYRFTIGNDSQSEIFKDNTSSREKFDYLSDIEDIAFKLDFDYFPSPKHNVKFGFNYTNHSFDPGITTLSSTTNDDDDLNSPEQNVGAHEFSVYAEDDFTLSQKLKFNLGVHWSGFNVENTFYQSFEPRASVRFLASDRLSLKAAYSKMQQYIHLLSSSTLSLPTDLWLPVTKRVKPMKSQQIAIGGAYKISDRIDFSLEGFYKKMDNLIDYKEGASFFGIQQEWEDKVTIGQGWSYGVEALLSKEIGKTTGWIGYTLSWADRQFDELNFGEKFPARYDRRHDISIALTHKFSKKIDIGATWVYGTGNAYTVASHKYNVFNQNTNSSISHNYYGTRNSYRMPNYHRFDIGVNFNKQKKHGVRTWNFSIYNAYSRQNAFYLYFDDVETETPGEYKTVLKQLSIFPIIPSITYSYKF